MATIRNPTPYRLFSYPIRRVLEGFEIVDGLTDAEADEACATGVFERGVLVTTEPEATDPAEENDEEEPKRPAGRRSSTRGAARLEETTDDGAEREER